MRIESSSRVFDGGWYDSAERREFLSLGSVPHMVGVVGAGSFGGLAGGTPYAAAALEAEADPAQHIGDQALIVEAEPDGFDADAVEHERMMRLERWQRQR